MIAGPVGHQRTIVARQRALMRWYQTYGRHRLPWRRRITPYGVLVSEVMLQQTQVDRVMPYWTAWMRRWPTIAALARAKRASVIRAWAGLGYNRRAVNLHRAAQEIVRDARLKKTFQHSQECWNVYPEGEVGYATYSKRVLQLPGVGPYTANAILAFAWNVPAPCVDTNVRRVLAYAMYRRLAIMRLPMRRVMELAARVIPPGRGRDWNYALMDYGALVLTARHPSVQNRALDKRRRVQPERFEGSSRFWRGRIVAVLRSSPRALTTNDLRIRLAKFGAPPSNLRVLSSALVHDGVVTMTNGRYRLPTT